MAEYNGTAGDDTYAGGAEADEIYGYGGKDILSGGGEDDYIEGGADGDTLMGEGGNDYLVGDFLSFGGSPAGDDQLYGGDGYDELHGGGGNDGLSGGADGDILVGEAGNDVLSGGDGNDLLRGGEGVDIFDGGTEDGSLSLYGDRVSFQETRATQGAIADLRTGIIANDGFGNQEVMTSIESLGAGTAFADQLYGNDGINSLSGGRGDTLMAFAGDDSLNITGAPAVLDGGSGTDQLQLALWGGLIADPNGGSTAVFAPTMTAGYTIDLAAGTLADGDGLAGTIAGIERITATAAADVLRGSGADEWFAPGKGADTIDGRGGVDTLSYANSNHIAYFEEHSGGIYVDLQTGQIVETTAQPIIQSGFFDHASPPAGQAGPGSTPESIDQVAGIENVVGTGLGDTIYGDSADNRITPGAGNDVVDGRGGIDTIDYSGARAAVTIRLDQGTAVEQGTGEVILSLSGTNHFGTNAEADDYATSTDQLTGIENAVGSEFADVIRGSSGDNGLDGAGGNDFLWLMDGGNDSAQGGAGNDVFLFGGAMTSADSVEGSIGTDQIVLQGDYAGAEALTLGASVKGFESIAILPGNDIRFGDPGTNSYDYEITTVDANVAAGGQVIVDANRLRAGEDFTFNGSAETDGGFFVWGGGGVDILTGGSMTDIFYFGENLQFGANDTVDGGGGTDQLGLRGNYTIVFGAGQLSGIENIGLVSAQDTRFGALGSTYNYNLTMNDANLASGVLMTVDGAALRGGETLTFNGSAETDGLFRIFGGQGSDVITTGSGADIIQGGRGADDMTGGDGADTFRYVTTLDSTGAAMDEILDFAPGTDKIDLARIDANTLAGGDQAFSWIGSNAFSNVAGELRAYESGGTWFVEGDTDGNGVADLVIAVTTQSGAPLVQGDFVP
jgi:Ca2+-binding RTX toxin-like protein